MHEISRFFAARPVASARARAGTIKVAEAATLVASVLGLSSADDQQWRLALRGLRCRISQLCNSDGEIDFVNLAWCLSKFAQVELLEVDMQMLWESLPRPQPRRRERDELVPLQAPPVDHQHEDDSAHTLVPHEDPATKFNRFTKHELQAMLATLEQEGADRERHLRRQLERSYQEKRNLRKHVRLVEDRLVQVKAECHDLAVRVCWRDGRRRISPFGGYTLALLRNLSHTGGAEAVQMIAGDSDRGQFKSKNIVYEYEIKAAIVHQLLSKSFHEGLYDQQHEVKDTMDIFVYKGDATNQEALDKSKVHVSSLDTFHCCLPTGDSDTNRDGIYEAFSFNRARCD